jgi:hypothetical protein
VLLLNKRTVILHYQAGCRCRSWIKYNYWDCSLWSVVPPLGAWCISSGIWKKSF